MQLSVEALEGKSEVKGKEDSDEEMESEGWKS